MDTKFQTKHESDMTSKEKRELEYEKLASMNKKEKAEYILAYYKFQIAAVVLGILLIIGIFKWMDGFQDENMLYVAVVDATSDGGTLMEDFRKSVGDEEEHHKFIMDTSIILNSEVDGTQVAYSSRMKLTTLVGAGEVDIYICPEDLYQEYAGEDGALLPVAELMGEEFVTEHADICEEYGVRVDGSEMLGQYGLKSKEPAYLIVFYYTEHRDMVSQFVEFVTDGKISQKPEGKEE